MLSPLLRCGRHIDEALRDENGRKLSKSARRAEAVRRLAEVGIHDPTVADRYPFELSGGMRQRVGIAAALARDPRILIADEPSTALDVTTQKEILALLRSLQQSRAMGLILITHDLRVAFSMCDRITVLYAGSVLEVAPAQATRARAAPPLHAGPPALGAAGRSPALLARGDSRLGRRPRRGRRRVRVLASLRLGGAAVPRGQAPAALDSATAGSRPASAPTSCGIRCARRARRPTAASTSRSRRRAARRSSRSKT